MTSSYNESVMSFDLGYLQQQSSNTNTNKVLKYRENIAKVKSKILGLNALIEKCHEQKEIIESTSKSLHASKEECKQLCINYKNVLEKCENLENDIKTLQLHNQQLHHKLTDAENQYGGMQSFAKQLEVLAKEREIQIESLTVENNLEKANSKKFASKTSSLQKRYERVLRDMCIFGKFLRGNKKLPSYVREVLNKYAQHIADDNEDSCHDSSGDHSDNDIDVFDSKLKTSKSPHDTIKREGQASSTEIEDMIVVTLNRTENENETDRYSECSNEIASADTGRGSSLAFSDSEKCFLSPDSFLIDNHDSPEMISKATKGTNPKRVIETMDVATSPLRNEPPVIPIITIDKAVGPDYIENITRHQNCYASQTRTRPAMIDASIQNDANDQEVQFTVIKEKKCLQVNSCYHFSDEDNSENYVDEMASMQNNTNSEEDQFTDIREKCLQVNSSNHYSDEDDSGNSEVRLTPIQNDSNVEEVQITDIQENECLRANSSIHHSDVDNNGNSKVLLTLIQNYTNSDETELIDIQEKECPQVNSSKHHSDEDNSGNSRVRLASIQNDSIAEEVHLTDTQENAYLRVNGCNDYIDEDNSRNSEVLLASIQNDANAKEVQLTDIQEKECLRVNSSDDYSDEDNSGNYEVCMTPMQNDTNAEEVQFTDIQEKECLRVNSSHYNDGDKSGNYEVEMILKKMKFNRELITPIPSSPSNSRSSVISEVSVSQTDNSYIATMCKKIKILEVNQAKMIKAIVNLTKQNMKLTSKQPDINLNTVNTSNVDIDISELDQLYITGNTDVVDKEKSLNENSVDVRKTTVDNEKETDERQHRYDCAESIQQMNENGTDSDDLIEMADLIQVHHHENMPLDDFITTNSRDLMDNEGITHSLALNSQVDSMNIMEEQENSSERIISRLEFEEDDICTSPSQPSDINKETCRTSETITADNYPPTTEHLHCNESVKRKMNKLNNLEKLRRKMIPKSKIQRETVLAKRPRVQKRIGNCIRRSNVKLPKKKITANDSSVSLNDKTVYDNAVRIMAELKSKKRSKESLHKLALKSNRLKKVKNIRLLKPKHAEIYNNTAKIQSDPSELSVEKRITLSTENSFDISDLISKLTQKPVIKSLQTANTQNKCIEKNNRMDLSEFENSQSLKLIQPVILVDRLQETTDFGREIQYDKTDYRNKQNTSIPPSPSINTRSRGKCVEKPQLVNVDPSIVEDISPKENRKRLKRISTDDNRDIEHKRILRSSTRQFNFDENPNVQLSSDNMVDLAKNDKSPKVSKCNGDTNNSSLDNKLATAQKTIEHNKSISYDDLDMFNETVTKRPESLDIAHDNPKDSILCTMLEKFSLSRVNFIPKKIPDHIFNTIGKLIEDNLQSISKLTPSETKTAMDDFVVKLKPFKWKDFIATFMKYLQDPQRKVELYAKVNSPPAPPMTKHEQILLYVIIKLKSVWPEVDIVNAILNQMEYVLFKINQTPEFDVIESMSHFYACICRCFGMKIRLRSFMLDAMYCLQFKAIALIKQCIDVWMHVIPLAHMGIAKNPLVTCLVYLLHFYKCDDHFNRVQDIRNILHRKYFYQMSDWNEKRILEVVKNAIYEATCTYKPDEKKILRRSILVLAKRQGPQWCQKNIIMNMLLPIIEEKNSSENVKLFCISILGPLMKPYPADMKVHCEIVMNSLLDIAKQKPSPATEEAVFSSLIYMNKHNPNRVIGALLSWHPKHKVSPEFYAVLRDFVREKPAHAWRKVLSTAYLASELEVSEVRE